MGLIGCFFLSVTENRLIGLIRINSAGDYEPRSRKIPTVGARMKTKDIAKNNGLDVVGMDVADAGLK